ncbi:class I SAM-dependent methyltransferase [Algoriphagus aestuarii]|nr:class I SAM-dependent methyltransferase [Algoriphagus aestuarii]
MSWPEIHHPEFQQFVQDHLQEDPALLLLKYTGRVPFDLKEAVQQIASRQKGVKKLPEWTKNPDLIFPASLSLEQSSSEETAKFKSEGLEGASMIDLTGGFGVDSFYLSQGFDKAVYCEQQPDLFQLTKHNLEKLAPEKFEFFQGDGLEFLPLSNLKFDLIYADPARRGKGNQKLYKIQDCEPDLVSSWELLKSKADQILLKYSPMLDISQALGELPEIQKITILSVKNEVKELLLFWDRNNSNKQREIKIQDLGNNHPAFTFSPQEEEQAVSQISEVEKYLIEPISGILKSGSFKLFGQRFGLQKLDLNSHLYTCSEIPENIPARIFEIKEEVSPKKKEIQSRFPTGKVNILTRNYSSKPEEIKKKFGLKDGGEDFLIGTKTVGGFKLFWCKRIK